MPEGPLNDFPLASPDEALVLADVRRRTGRRFQRVQGIRTDDPAVAREVLPILAEWLDVMPDGAHRAAILDRFQYTSGGDFLHTLLKWWRAESCSVSRYRLTELISRHIQADNALEVWQVFQAVPRDDSSVFALRRFAQCAVTADVAAAEALRMISSGQVGIGHMQVLSQIKDARIQAWFRGQLRNPDEEIRRVAQQVAGRRRRLPLGLVPSSSGPDRAPDEFSFEGAMEHWPKVLGQIEARTGVKIPKWLKRASFLVDLDIDQWVVTRFNTKGKRGVEIWIRLEDSDVVEVVVRGDADSRDQEKIQ